MRWIKRYFNFAQFPAEARKIFVRGLLGEAIALVVLAWTLWRINEIAALTIKRGGKYIALTGGATYGSTEEAGAPSWEKFIQTYWADQFGLTGARVELEIAWVLMALALLAFGAWVLFLDWRRPKEERYRPALYLLSWVNLGIALYFCTLADSKIGQVIAICCQVLVALFFLLRPAAKHDSWRSRV